MAEPVWFHIDVNSAFLSWTAAYRTLVEGRTPDLREIPSVIANDKNLRTSIVLAKSTPAKKYGVKTGEPLGMARDKCPNLVVAEPDYALYVSSSRRLMALLREVSPVVEQYSIDEAWVDMTGMEGLYGPPVLAAQHLRDRIFSTLGFTVNIGISCNKLLAKMAGELEKPNKVITLFPQELSRKLWPLPVGALYSVGRATASKLTASQIRTIGDLAKTDLTRVQKLVGVKMGKLIHDYANEMDSSPVLAEPEAVKGYGNSVTLEEDVTDTAQANKILLALCDSVASRMRADGRRCSCVTVTIRGNDFRNKSHQRKLPEPTDVTAEVFALSKTLFSELWDGYTPLRLLGVTLGDISDNETVQLSMFQDDQKDRARKLDQTVDQLRSKFGVTAISRGSVTDATKRVGRKYKAQLEEDKPKQP